MEEESEIEQGPPAWPLLGNDVFVKRECYSLWAAKVTKEDWTTHEGLELRNDGGRWKYHVTHYYKETAAWVFHSDLVPCTKTLREQVLNGPVEPLLALNAMNERTIENILFDSWRDKSFTPSPGLIVLVKQSVRPLWPSVIQDEVQASERPKRYTVELLGDSGIRIVAINQMKEYTPYRVARIADINGEPSRSALQNANRQAKDIFVAQLISQVNRS